jgi:hypothetical protein
MYNHLKKGSFHLHLNFLERKLFEKLKSDLPTLKYKATYQPHNTYYGNRFQSYPCYELKFPTHNHIIIPKLEAILQEKIDKKSFECIMRKTIIEEVQRSKVNTVYGTIHTDTSELAAVLYFDQTTSGGTVFFEQHWDKHPDVSVGAYPNRLILYNAQRWHTTATDFTFKERYVLAMFFNTEKSKRDINEKEKKHQNY